MVQVNISIPEEDIERVRAYAKTHDLKVSQLFRNGIRRVINFDN